MPLTSPSRRDEEEIWKRTVEERLKQLSGPQIVRVPHMGKPRDPKLLKKRATTAGRYLRDFFADFFHGEPGSPRGRNDLGIDWNLGKKLPAGKKGKTPIERVKKRDEWNDV